MKINLYVKIGGVIVGLAAGLFLFFRYRNPIKFQSLKLLEKGSLLQLLSQIRTEFSNRFASTLRLNRKKRRNLTRGSREYRILIKELKEQAKKSLQLAIDEVLSKYGVSESILTDSSKHFECDEDIKKSMGKLCSVEVTKVPTQLTLTRLEEILEFYLSKAEEFHEEDPNELNLKMKMLEDEIHDEFKFEPEEIEAAVNKYENKIVDLVASIRQLNNALLEQTNEDLFF